MLLVLLLLLLVLLHDLLMSSHLLLVQLLLTLCLIVLELTMPAVHLLCFSARLVPLVHGGREELVNGIAGHGCCKCCTSLVILLLRLLSLLVVVVLSAKESMQGVLISIRIRRESFHDRC